MKIKLIALVLCLIASTAMAQQDSTKKEESKTLIKIGKGQDSSKSVHQKKPSPSNFSIQLTLSRIDLGLAKFTDNGSLTLSPANQFLETQTWKTSNVGFEFVQMGYRFNHNFKVYLATGKTGPICD